MKEEITPISVEQIEKEMSEKPMIKADWNGLTVLITPTLSLEDVMTIVESVVKTCFQEDGTYLPEVKDFAIRKNIVEKYANFKLSDDPEKDYDILYNTDIVDVVMANINRQQYIEIMKAIDNKLEYSKQVAVITLHKQMSDLLAAFASLEEKIADIFSEVNADDLNNLVQTIGAGAFDMDALIRAATREAEEHSKGTATL